MNARVTLPGRREAETFDITFDGFGYAVTLGRYEDGRPAEIFIDAHKRATAIDVAARDVALLISFTLQFDVPLDALRQACSRDSAGAPQGLVGAILDHVAGLP